MNTITAKSLAQLVGQRTLQFDFETFKKLINTITENQLHLDSSAVEMMGNMVNSLTTTSVDAHAKIQMIYIETIHQLDEASSNRLQNMWKSIANLPDLSIKAREAMSLKAMDHAHNQSMQDRKTAGINSNLMTGGLVATLITFAASKAYKSARKPTFMESIFGKK